ncbi:helix-turn-helix domain-containing protein [Paenibacillus nasutitermitis]|uniref:HTH-type transcriptional activator RhaR n=1 Tax=Paenibacillus nasutitermitis TaxID=1652958 RepID=A0A916YQ69_9BACL|nr:AraC family transcriptional regulator [Paenibacillus nasutitermitis]GGD56279.1 HTH-type transcriptional activator RhaR [Paenibacillus nasutitermitis]
MKIPKKIIRGDSLWEPDLPLFVNRGGESFLLSMHTHDFVEIAYITEGRGLHYIGTDLLHVEQGDLFVIAIGTPHVFRPYSIEQDNNPVVYNCVFDRNYIQRFRYSLPQWGELQRIFQNGDYEYRYYKNQQDEIGAMIEKMYMEYTMRLPGYQLVLNSYMLNVISTLYRYEILGVSPSTTRNRLDRVFKHIHASFHENLKVEDLAALVPISTSHLQRLFRQLSGQTVTEYVQSWRIKKGCELLSYTSESVQEIAGKVGYKDHAYFHALFKRKIGMSPVQYRKLQERSSTEFIPLNKADRLEARSNLPGMINKSSTFHK